MTEPTSTPERRYPRPLQDTDPSATVMGTNELQTPGGPVPLVEIKITGVAGEEGAGEAGKMAASTPPNPPKNPPGPQAEDDRPDPPSPKETSEAYKALVKKAQRLAADAVVQALTPQPGLEGQAPSIELSRATEAADLLAKLQGIVLVEEWTRKLEKAILEKPERMAQGPSLPPSLAKLSGYATRAKKAQAGDKREGRHKGTGTDGPLPQDD